MILFCFIIVHYATLSQVLMSNTMNSLEAAIKKALDLSGSTNEANKVYLEFIKANFMIPINKFSDPEKPEVLFLVENEHTFLPVFTDKKYLDQWAFDIKEDIELLKLSGVDLLKGVGDKVIICLNIGSTIYKEFNIAEIERMRSLVLKVF